MRRWKKYKNEKKGSDRGKRGGRQEERNWKRNQYFTKDIW